MDDYWYLAHNADTGQEGMILAKEMKIIKNLPGQDIVVSEWLGHVAPSVLIPANFTHMYGSTCITYLCLL